MTLRSSYMLILSLLLGSVLAADAQVMNVAVSPSPALVGQPATVTVTGGSAPCGAVEIDYGDGPSTFYPISALPLTQPHTWTTVGNKTVVATGQGNCTGQATVTVGVVRSNTPSPKLGVNKSPPPKFPMLIRIKSYFGLSQPGGLAAIAGQNFGAQQGTVVARLKKWSGFHKEVPLRVNDWSPTLIEVTWPTDIDGVRDQMDAVVEVTHANNTAKAGWKVFFRAETDYKVLPMSRVSVVTCGDDANYNVCNRTIRGDGGDCAGPGIDAVRECRGSFYGRHYNCWGAVGNDGGFDEFELRLRRGWVVSGLDFQKSSGGSAVWNPSPPAPAGSAAWNARVKWEVTPSDTAWYCAFVHISGPKGVPF